MVKVPTKTLERDLLAQGYERIIGVDEVGMACLAGPVVVCALAAGPDFYSHYYEKLARMRDSKTLQAHQREYFVRQLEGIPGLTWQIASCDPETIDRVNIYQASRIAMREAIDKLLLKNNQTKTRPFSVNGLVSSDYFFVLVDGNKIIQNLELPQRAIIKGDRKVWAIAAASILAKVHRDQLMTDYATQYPGYGFEIHKGYPTRLHRQRLAELGPCPLHRRSFHGTTES